MQKLRLKPFINKINTPNFWVAELRERVSQMIMCGLSILRLLYTVFIHPYWNAPFVIDFHFIFSKKTKEDWI